MIYVAWDASIEEENSLEFWKRTRVLFAKEEDNILSNIYRKKYI